MVKSKNPILNPVAGALLLLFLFCVVVCSVRYLVNFCCVQSDCRGPVSIVGITTAYRLDGPGIESPWGRDFPHLSRPALRPTQPPVQWVPGLSRG